MNEHILKYEVEFALNRAKLNKAVGIDGMSNEMFKNKFSLEFIFRNIPLNFRKCINSKELAHCNHQAHSKAFID